SLGIGRISAQAVSGLLGRSGLLAHSGCWVTSAQANRSLGGMGLQGFAGRRPEADEGRALGRPLESPGKPSAGMGGMGLQGLAGRRPEADEGRALGRPLESPGKPCAGMGAYIKTQGLEAKTLLEESE